MTPEGRVKKKIKTLLKEFSLWYDMPVPGGYGRSTIDFIGVHRGDFFAIEAKAPGKKPTELQDATLAAIYAAGGATFVVDGDDSLAKVREWLLRHDTSKNIKKLFYLGPEYSKIS